MQNKISPIPPSLWNQRDAATSGLAKTTNAVRAGIMAKSYFSGPHPSIWKVIANLQKDAFLQKLSFFNASSGNQFTKKKTYRILNEKVQNLRQVYEEKTDLHFFHAMANLSYGSFLINKHNLRKLEQKVNVLNHWEIWKIDSNFETRSESRFSQLFNFRC